MYVSIKCSIKEIFDAGQKAAALEALSAAVKSAVDGNKAFDTKKADKVGIVLTVSASVTSDDKDKPTKLKAVVNIDGLLTGGAAQAFKATGNGSVDVTNPKKLDRDVKDLVGSVAGDLMKNRVIPQMLKMSP